MVNTELFKEVVEIRYVGSGDDELGNGSFYLIFDGETAMNRAIKNLENEQLSSELSFDVILAENKLQATFTLRDEIKDKRYSTEPVRCSESDISEFKIEDSIGRDGFAFGLVKVAPASMDAIKVKHGTAYRS